jgi:hypothetical protein
LHGARRHDREQHANCTSHHRALRSRRWSHAESWNEKAQIRKLIDEAQQDRLGLLVASRRPRQLSRQPPTDQRRLDVTPNRDVDPVEQLDVVRGVSGSWQNGSRLPASVAIWHASRSHQLTVMSCTGVALYGDIAGRGHSRMNGDAGGEL